MMNLGVFFALRYFCAVRIPSLHLDFLMKALVVNVLEVNFEADHLGFFFLLTLCGN